MDETEHLLVQRIIGSIIDHPNVYMGGPTRYSMRKAEAIIQALEIGKRLVSTTCDHRAWVRSTTHVEKRGTYCPDCDTLLSEDVIAALLAQEVPA